MKTNKKCDKKGRLAGNLKLLANENSRGRAPVLAATTRREGLFNP